MLPVILNCDVRCVDAHYRITGNMPTPLDDGVVWMRSIGAFLDKHKRFVLDNRIFSSIIYIWYEGVRLRPLVVER